MFPVRNKEVPISICVKGVLGYVLETPEVLQDVELHRHSSQLF